MAQDLLDDVFETSLRQSEVVEARIRQLDVFIVGHKIAALSQFEGHI